MIPHQGKVNTAKPSQHVKHFDGNEISLPLSQTAISSSNLSKTGTLNSASDENMTLHLAAWTANITVVEKFVQNCANGETLSVDEPGFTPLHLAE